jgi:molybdopterin-guanine dinucleotide biosynthesis protein A
MDGNEAVVGEVSGVILAGGRARRFNGHNKATLQVDGQPIIDRQLVVLRRVTTRQAIIANDPAPFCSAGVPVIGDLVVDAGPLGGLYTALKSMPDGRVIVLACDLPYVHDAFLRHLLVRAPRADAVVPRTDDGLHPLCAVYATRLLPVVESAIGRRELALHDLLERIACEYVESREVATFDADGRLLMNVNTPADYEALGPAALP